MDECRWLYNHFLEERKNSWEQEKKSISYFDQCKSIPSLKEQRQSLNNVYSQVLQNVADRVDKAFQGFSVELRLKMARLAIQDLKALTVMIVSLINKLALGGVLRIIALNFLK